MQRLAWPPPICRTSSTSSLRGWPGPLLEQNLAGLPSLSRPSRVHSSSDTKGPGSIFSHTAADSSPRFFSHTRLPLEAGTSILLSAEESRHATRALRLGQDAWVEIFDGSGKLGQGRLEVGRRQTSVLLEGVRQEKWALPKWTLAVAMSDLSASRADWLVEKATELGAWSLLPFISQHTHKGGADRSTKKMDRWRSLSLAACKQCRRLHGLSITDPVAFHSLLKELQVCQREGGAALVALQGGRPLQQVAATLTSPAAAASRSILVVGPEGDFTREEKEMLLEIGSQAIGLGPLRLRVETAAISALANLMLT
ncbi:hypothetical protein WJX74_000838 [Apatococcus lobatus]|uniref:16S rRNA (uracil(1498)-N(3))-methyltransferase n=1 Tax=Apatococcus lobatus TaxID=904363 RepID=A0AAW1QJS1_9CHLO